MKTEYFIKTVKNGVFWESTIQFIDENKIITLVYRCDSVVITVKDEYPFFALIKLRLELEQQNSILLCNGARVDVYPSGSSAVGIMAYQLENKKQATKLINIFEPVIETSRLASVHDQKLYRDSWLKSL